MSTPGPQLSDDLRRLIRSTLDLLPRVVAANTTFVSCIMGDDFEIVDAVDEQSMGFYAGQRLELSDTMCIRHLKSDAPAVTGDAAEEPAYRDAPARTQFGITTYAVAPIVLADGTCWGTLCALDRRRDVVDESGGPFLAQLARLLARAIDGELQDRPKDEIFLALARRLSNGRLLDHAVGDVVADVDKELRGVVEVVNDLDLERAPVRLGQVPPASVPADGRTLRYLLLLMTVEALYRTPNDATVEWRVMAAPGQVLLQLHTGHVMTTVMADRYRKTLEYGRKGGAGRLVEELRHVAHRLGGVIRIETAADSTMFELQLDSGDPL